MSKRESFYLPNRELRIQPNADGSRTIVGQIPYNSPSAGLPWTETISPGAFANALKPDAEVLLVRQHDISQLFGNTLSGSLVLSDTPEGLNFRCQLPNTTQAADLVESMARKDLRGVSFGMLVTKQVWSEDANGNVKRSILSLDLFEISLCSFAVYGNASASIRSLVPKALRPLLKRSNADGCDCSCESCEDGDCDECTETDCDDAACAENGCPEQDEGEDRSKPLNWSERTALQIEVARRLL